MIANILFALMVIFSGTPATAPALSTDVLPACEFEDSTNCFWDASERGNGQGADFHDIDGVAYYACDGFEDSANCFWDASTQGNGTGRSFTDVDGVAVYWDEIAAWDAWDASGVSEDLMADGGKVSYAGAYEGQELVASQALVDGYVFSITK